MEKHKGFTVIEVMLFLAITGLIMSFMLVGLSTGINRERYRDAVNSYINFWQGQYNAVTNVSNNRVPSDVCDDTNAAIIEGASIPDGGAGTSDCTIVGRVIYNSADGKTEYFSTVYSAVDVSAALTLVGQSDTAVLKAAKLFMSPDKDAYELAWGASVGKVGANSTVNDHSVLIVRMPTNGQIHTYYLDSTNKLPSEILDLGSTNADAIFCVAGAGLTLTASQGVILRADASNSSGVVFAPEGVC